jgi:hypothetical protein
MPARAAARLAGGRGRTIGLLGECKGRGWCCQRLEIGIDKSEGIKEVGKLRTV